MTAIEYLRQLESLSEKIQQKKDELKSLTEMQTFIGAVDYSKPNIQSQPKGEAAFERAADRFIMLDAEIRAEISGYLETKHEIINTIQSLKNAKYVKVLYKKYVEFKTIETVADEIGYSLQYVKELHAEAINKVDEALNNLQKTYE